MSPNEPLRAIVLAVSPTVLVGSSGTISKYLSGGLPIVGFLWIRLIWVTGLGFLIFGNLPDAWTLTGAGIIIASGLYTSHRERLRTVQKFAKPRPVV